MSSELSNRLSYLPRWRRIGFWLMICTLSLATVLIAIVQFSAPFIQKNHIRIESWLSREIGHQVSFEHIHLQWSKATPVIVLHDFIVKADPQSQHLLQVQKMQFAIDWWESLRKWDLRLGKWKVSGVDIDLAQMGTGTHAPLELHSLFVTADKWVGDNPITIKMLTLRLNDVNQQLITLIFDDIELDKQRGLSSLIDKPAPRPWLKQLPASAISGEEKKQLRLQGQLHSENNPQQKLKFIIESAPYTSTTQPMSAKLYINSQHIPFSWLPKSLGPMRDWLVENDITGEAWLELQENELHSVQITFHSTTVPDNTGERPPVTVGGHLYAVKDAAKGWWITADNLQIKAAKHEAIQGKFAIQYRYVDLGGIDWLVRVPQFTLTQGDAQLSGQLNWQQPMTPLGTGSKPQAYIKLAAQAKDFPLQQILSIIPAKTLYPSLQQWLYQAPKAGVLQDAMVDIEGGVEDIIQGKPAAKIVGHGNIKDLILQYHHAYPKLQADAVAFTLKQNDLVFTLKHAVTQNAPIDSLAISVTPLFNKDKIKVIINSKTKLDFASARQFIRYSPLTDSVGKRLEPLGLAGAGVLDLRVDLPLYQASPHDDSSLQVQGELGFNQAGLRLKQWPVIINRLDGKLHFTESHLYATDLQGLLWGEKIHLQLSTETVSTGKQTSVQAATRLALPTLAREFPVVDKLPLLGNAEVNISLVIPPSEKEAISLKVQSDLVGVYVALPAPLGKSTSVSKPSMVKALIYPDANNDFHVEYANKQVLIDINKISNTASNWLFTINSPEVIGKATFAAHGNKQTLIGKFKRFYINQTDQPKSQDTLNPAMLPAMNITVEDFKLDKKQLGRLTLLTEPSPQGQVITKLQSQSNAFAINAQGKWIVQNQKHSTVLDGTFTSKNFNRALKALAITPSLESDKVRIDYSLNWPGAPYDFSMQQLNGSANFNLQEGRVLNISKQTSQIIGIGRMLNMLSIASIPKRLRLDFSDLTETGLHFNEFKGKVLVLQGDAKTSEAILEGPVSRIRWRGRVGLGARDYDLIMRVEPHMTSSLPIVAAIAGGPIVGPVAGVATWMMNKAIAPDLERLSSYTYEIKGTWAEPMVRSIDPGRMSYRAPVEDKTQPSR